MTLRPANRPALLRDRAFRGRPRLESGGKGEAMIANKGVHGFVMVMSTESLIAFCNHDLWLRAFIVVLATISVAGSGLAWRNLTKTSELQIRLVRASELNSHLRGNEPRRRRPSPTKPEIPSTSSAASPR